MYCKYIQTFFSANFSLQKSIPNFKEPEAYFLKIELFFNSYKQFLKSEASFGLKHNSALYILINSLASPSTPKRIV